MWGNLAGKVGKVGAQDWNAALKKIGNAVAPPPGDEDEYYEDDEEEYDEDDGYENEEEEEEEEEDSQPTGFGFVGLLARALDREEEEHDDESYSNHAEESSFEPVTTSSKPLFDDQWSQEPPTPLPVVPMVKEWPSTEVKPISTPAAPPAAPTTPEYSKVEGRNADYVKPSLETVVSNSATYKPSIPAMSEPLKQPATKNISKRVSTSVAAQPKEIVHSPQRLPEGGSDTKDRPVGIPLHQDTQLRPSQRAMESAKLPPVVAETSKSSGSSYLTKPAQYNDNKTRLAELQQKVGAAVVETYDSSPHAAKVEHKPRPSIDVKPQSNSGKVAARSDLIPLHHDHEIDLALQQAEGKVVALQKQLHEETEKANQMRETMMIQFQEKEARILLASQEEYQHEMAQAEHRYQTQVQSLEMRLANEKNEYTKGQQSLKQMIEESNARADQAETELRNVLKGHESQLAQANYQDQRTIRMAEDKLAQSMALLDERDEEISRLRATVKKLESSMNEHEEGVEEVEQEVEELHDENEALQEQVDHLEAECTGLKEKVAALEGERSQLGALQMELTMLREERDRERAKSHSVVQSTITSHSQVESERDSALAEVRDLKQQLTAALADLEVARADQERILVANNNLQSALEAFQDERQAEMSLVDEQRMEAEEAIKSAHAAAIEALKQIHAEEILQAQFAGEARVRHAMDQTRELQMTLNKLKAENSQTRRSLDEAIHRLQTTQEDIIDRTLMKNILLDWCTMKDKDKRHQVLQLMASVLHFTDEEKEKVHLTHMDIESVRSRVVGALAAPLPPSKAKLEALEGENVSEKWVNFLMAETDDGF